MPGEIFGLLGPNGAGKTSAIRMMLGIVAPDTGTVRLFGGTADRASLRHAGYLPEERGLYPKMSVHDNLTFFGELNGLDLITAQSQSRTWCERLDLGDRVDDKVESLSKGLQQKVQFIAAILHKPEFIAIDEPFTALDSVNVIQLRELLSEFGRKAERYCSRPIEWTRSNSYHSICLISHGQSSCKAGCEKSNRVIPHTAWRLHSTAAATF